MGVYWGSKYIAVLDEDLNNCRVEQVDLKPEPKPLCEPETVYAPVPHELMNYPLLDHLAEAKDVVLRHILSETSERILELTFSIEHIKLRAQAAKRLKQKDLFAGLEYEVSTLDDLNSELKLYRELRRSKIKVC